MQENTFYSSSTWVEPGFLVANSSETVPIPILEEIAVNAVGPIVSHQPALPELICFGMIPGIPGRCDFDPALSFPFKASILSSDSFSAIANPKVTGNINSSHGQINYGPVVHELLAESSVVFHAMCCTDPTNPRGKTNSRISCLLELTVYGPPDLSEEIGSWLQSHNIYLQDPKQCHLDTKYYNPQRLSSTTVAASPMVSDVVRPKEAELHLQEVTQLPDILDAISSNEELEEALTPSAICSILQRWANWHTKSRPSHSCSSENGDGPSLAKEKISGSWNPAPTKTCEQPNFIFRVSIESGETITLNNLTNRRFHNRVSGHRQVEEPPQFFGGVIADPMGFGKTLTMIALVASGLGVTDGIDDCHPGDCTPSAYAPPIPFPKNKSRCNSTDARTFIISVKQLGGRDSGARLLIWRRHTHTGAMRCHRHHANTRITSPESLEGVAIVLTTYHTVSAEWMPGIHTKSNTVLFGVRWARIILDEGKSNH
ncbi:hypothetical protein PpBr36_02652 [Pyricularia pennisetigena]|uniref:hypothetical protein n=1 Tax=Pyricularia pennisetigena TaxID=1578925 RepID=UPI0011542792|nr:hypothetical protein PpBr36_02652 [Pyricularia pennisetigena]TLS30089.1 hypothetical protein PpBr36_02652 [Pyricularia pennisetigena]